MTTHYVYGYKWNGEWIYIGHGKGHRKTIHLCPSRLSQNKPFYKKLREIIANGETPEIVVLHEGISKEDAKQKEYELINQIGLIGEGGSLLNIYKRDGDIAGEANPKIWLGVIGEANPFTKTVVATNLLTGEQFTINGAAKMKQLGFHRSAVSMCCNGHLKSHKRHSFRFA